MRRHGYFVCCHARVGEHQRVRLVLMVCVQRDCNEAKDQQAHAICCGIRLQQLADAPGL
ncbi:MAG: hypothetical protein NT107_04965 [Planctomycetota bacterium]|nr:hypothetical protein [Planctomycetota bacterium]